MENLEEKKGSTLGSCQSQEVDVSPKQANGSHVIPVMTEEEISNLLARLQDVLSLWGGSDNRIMNGFVMTVFPIPLGMTIGKVEKVASHDKVFTVNNQPVVALE